MAWIAASGWLSVCFEYLIKSTVALTLGLVLSLLFRKRSASLRHFVLSLSLAGLLLLPVLRNLGGGWETSLLPARPAGVFGKLLVYGEDGPKGIISGSLSPNEKILLPSASSDPSRTPARGERLPRRFDRFFRTAVPLVWAAGLIFLLLRLAVGIWGASRLTREGKTVRDPRWRVLLERFLAAIHLRREVRLKSHGHILIPLTWGFLRPVVLIPDSHESWTEEQRSSTLVHELSHIKRADFLVMVLVRLSLAVFWFNPLSWVVFRRLKTEQEEACDELVLKTGIKPSTYAANLLFFKSTAGSRLSHFAALVGLFGFGKSAFNERLAVILRQKWTFQEVKMKTKIMLFCAIILAVALIGSARPSAPAAKEAGRAESSTAVPGLFIQDETASPVTPQIQAAGPAPEQGQAEEKKAKEQKPQEAQTQEKQAQERKPQAQEEQEKKDEKKPPVVVTVKEGEEHQSQIIIQEGDKVKTIVLDKPVIIKETEGGKVFIITSGGEELKAAEEGEHCRLAFKADKLEFIKEGKVVKVGKDGSTVYVIAKPVVDVGVPVDMAKINEEVQAALKDLPVTVKVVEPVVDVGKAVEAALEAVPMTVKVVDMATPHITVVSEEREKEIQQKLHEIREKLKAVEEKKLELRAVDEALADLEKDLEKLTEETSRVAIKIKEKPEVFTIFPKKPGEEPAAESKPDTRVAISEHMHRDPIMVEAKEKGLFILSYTLGPDGKSRENYDRIVARVKEELPEGFTLEPSFEEESGLITLKVKGPFEKGAPHDLVQKLADAIREEMKGKKE
jgi:beta-lactamase regulating signal transducer with metallopeptidase domain